MTTTEPTETPRGTTAELLGRVPEMLGTAPKTDGSANAPEHLWEIRHPLYGSSYGNEEVESFAQLRERINSCDEDLNFVYRWDWKDYSQPHYDGDLPKGDDRSEETFEVHVLQPRKYRIYSVTCPITKDQESEVLEWLRGPRVLGILAKWWEPLLDASRSDNQAQSQP
jgi:hypothetical protein